ncbi:DEAD/DEAH box helicase family protein [Agrobacterium rhizogenes]|nr:DEAD/DEAH box helicase family protein [Rhizobium rhizogenes]
MLEESEPIFFVPGDDFLASLVPAIATSDTLDCMMGFFSSASFAEIAPGLAAFLRRNDCPMRLIISPYVSNDDQKAFRDGLLSAEAIVERMFKEALPAADELAKHTLSCLAWMIRHGRLIIRVAVQREGLFHPKIWLLDLAGDGVVFHGSGNMTHAGLRRNKEQIAVARSWMDETQDRTVRRVRREFLDVWNGNDGDCKVVTLPRAIEDALLREYGHGGPPTEEDCWRLWRNVKALRDDDESNAIQPEPPIDEGFHIPTWLEYESGDFGHQGKAVQAWLDTGGRGILAMATGSGKTLTSLIACHRLLQKVNKLLIVVAAPYVPLVMQWCDEIAMFGLRPRNLSNGSGPSDRRREINDAVRNLKLGLSKVEALVVSHDVLTDPAFGEQLSSANVPKVLIADEMHNLGSASFIANPPAFFTYRLGLSATPIRQYDPEGTDRLFDFFGEPCFEFTLDEAIGVCLVPYDYYVHQVALLPGEMDEFAALSEQIRALAWKIANGDKDTHLDNLLRKRRLVLETAGGKIDALAALLDQSRPHDLSYELIYATDKAAEQLEAVNALLGKRGVLFHQLTAEETRDRKQTDRILKNFQGGGLQVLTAKRVLDEGVNVPQIKRAFILASTTVERQWVQRRGRILRRCDAVAKSFGVIHDFVAVPPANMLGDEDAKNIARGELRRVHEFARLARNYAAADGPIAAIERLHRFAYGV